MLNALRTFTPTTDNAGCCSKVGFDADRFIFIIWNEEAGHHIVHAWLWALWRHIIPESRAEGVVPARNHIFWMFKEVHLRVVCFIHEGCRESTVVKGRLQLERPS